tara:strand:- start:624 stop:899 length:276 start_codon:yes stop_codon:yes gene_type:complete
LKNKQKKTKMKNTEIQPKYKVGQIVECWDGFSTVDQLLIAEIDLEKGLYWVLNLSDVKAENNLTKFYQLWFYELERGVESGSIGENIFDYA